MLKDYREHVIERTKYGIPPKPLNDIQVIELVELLKIPPIGEETYLMELLTYRVPPGVDEASYIKANFLADIINDKVQSPLVTKKRAIELLGTMQGGYNILPLIDALDNNLLAPVAMNTLKTIILIFDNFCKIEEKANIGNIYAQKVINSWAKAEWFLSRKELAKKITVTVFRVIGETNTDDLSPAQDAWSRSDIPLHALTMLKNTRNGIVPDKPGSVGPVKQIQELNKIGYPLAYVGDVIGTGSSRKSATNSILWFIGNDIPYVPNKRSGGIILGGKIAPIFFNTIEDAGALPIEVNVSRFNMGDVIDIYPFTGEIRHHYDDTILANFTLKKNILIDEVRSGGRISLIIGRKLTARAREYLGLPPSTVFRHTRDIIYKNKGYTLAQKIVGHACDIPGVRPGQYCEPKITSVGSQDTTGPMTRDELKDLACLNFSADLVMQSFCHTAAYPKLVDIQNHHTLPNFIVNRGGVSLRPGDGIIHSWLNRMLLPDTVGTGGDSHTRFPIGISFPAGSGLVAFAAATGIMPLDMPESVLVRFKGTIQPGITLRDLVHAIPYYAIKHGLLTIEKRNKKNIFSGRILEIEGLSQLKVEQAFELTDASAERSAASCTIKLDQAPVIEYLNSNIVLLKWMISKGYNDRHALERRIKKMQHWLDKPMLLVADDNSEYASVIDINLNEIIEPILCVPNDPDDVHLLSDVAGKKIDEVFIGSCMTNIGHFRAVGKLLNNHNSQLSTRLWIAPPTKMDALQLMKEGYYSIFGKSGARIEVPGCSLCMGNQARVTDGATVVSTSTRNFPNRLGNRANVYLASAELATITSLLGHLPTVVEYLQAIKLVNQTTEDTYRYLNFNYLSEYINMADQIIF